MPVGQSCEAMSAVVPSGLAALTSAPRATRGAAKGVQSEAVRTSNGVPSDSVALGGRPLSRSSFSVASIGASSSGFAPGVQVCRAMSTGLWQRALAMHPSARGPKPAGRAPAEIKASRTATLPLQAAASAATSSDSTSSPVRSSFAGEALRSEAAWTSERNRA